MNYAVIKVVNGNYEVASEHGDNLIGAKTSWCTLCASLWNANEEVNAVVELVDENLDAVDGFSMKISHPAKNA